MVRIVLDVMGGDNCPGCNIDGALKALKQSENIELFLCGPADLIQDSLRSRGASSERIHIVNASEVISTDESPVQAVRKKTDSSIVKGISLLTEKQADAFVSSGSSGAVLAAGQLRLGRIRGVLRPPLGTVIPTQKGISLFLDLGANVDAKPDWLLQFAQMGSIYMQSIMGIENPSVKLINIGLEEEKGNALTKEANELLKNSGLNYQGYAEAREIPGGTADVIVTDAFTGNAMLKMYEGTAGLFLGLMKQTFKKNLKTKIAGLLIRKDLKAGLKAFDPSAYGGAPLLGVKGAVIKCHGNSTEKEICNAIIQAQNIIDRDVNQYIAKAFEKV